MLWALPCPLDLAIGFFYRLDVGMSEPSSQTVSLNDIGQRYIGALQHLCDMMVLTWAGARAVNEENYDQAFQSVCGLPSTPFHFPFAMAKAEAERWWLKNSLGEVLGLCQVFLEDIRKLCGLVVFNAAKNSGSGDLATLAAEINASSGPVDLASRFSQLKSRYNLAVPPEAELLSLAALNLCFLQSGGVIQKKSPPPLLLKFVQPPGQGETAPRIVDYKRAWKNGERISLSREEHAAIFTTASLFLSSMLTGVQELAKATGLVPEPPKP